MAPKVTNAMLSIKLDHVVGRVDDIHECVFGNSSPERGLAFRVSNNETFIRVQKRLIWIIVTASVGSVIAAVWSLLQLLAQAGVIVP
jgi:hypothetical protein